MADKFTPYALTALPAAQNRDVNGIYFIRTANGMEVYAIANTPTRDVVPLKVGGYVDLTSVQHINGKKIFNRVDFTAVNFSLVPNSNQGTIYLQELSGGEVGMNMTYNDSTEGLKSVVLLLDELSSAVVDYKVRNNTESQEVIKQSGKIVGRADNYLGFKKEFEFAQALTLSIGYNAIPFVDDYIPAWDDGQALIQSLQWDIVWDRGAGGALFQTQSLKYTHFSKMDTPIEIRRNPAGVWQFLGNLNAEIIIPQHAKLVIW